MRLALLYTTFPKKPETFLQREAQELFKLGAHIEFFSILGGKEKSFAGRPVRRLRIISFLWAALKALPIVLKTPKLWPLFFPSRWSGWVNYFENMAGIVAGVYWGKRLSRFDWVHAQWGAAPAMAALVAQKLNPKIKFSMGLHAYDLFEHGGDGWLSIKVPRATAVFSSNAQAQREAQLRFSPKRSYLVRRGLPPEYLEPLTEKEISTSVKIVTVARLIEKKGLEKFILLMAELKRLGRVFSAEIIGDGALRKRLQSQIVELGLGNSCCLTGWLPPAQVRERVKTATIFLFTGHVTPNGDRDGFPNVIAEAFAAGTPVIAAGSVGMGISEGVIAGETGVLLENFDTATWADEVGKLLGDKERYEKLRRGAYAWAKENFDAQKNAKKSLEIFEGLARED